MTEESKKLEITLEQLKTFGDHLVDEALHKSTPETRRLINELSGQIKTLDTTVKGWVRTQQGHNDQHDLDMQDLRPIIKEYKDNKVQDELITKWGNRISWGSKILIAVATFYVVLKYGLASLIFSINKP